MSYTPKKTKTNKKKKTKTKTKKKTNNNKTKQNKNKIKNGKNGKICSERKILETSDFHWVCGKSFLQWIAKHQKKKVWNRIKKKKNNHQQHNFISF